MENLLIVITLINASLLVLLVRNSNQIVSQIADLRDYTDGEYEKYLDELETDSEIHTAYEEALMKREEAFDQRIAGIKADLDKQHPPRKPSTVAEVLHPDVENLPHDSIIDYETNPPDIEYSK